jgi:two-component system phosphate regulon sensor histidine kinase PhoR
MRRRIVKKILEQLEQNSISPEYSELLPYMRKLEAERRESAAQLAKFQERAAAIETVTQNMQGGLILTDSTGIVLSANNSARKIFGELEGRNILHICREEDFQTGMNQCLSGDSAERQLTRDSRLYSVFLSPVRAAGIAATGAVILFLDTTERHRAEQQRREFSANVSHELKTPLTTISALAEMIESGMAKEADIVGFSGRIKEQAGRLLAIIDDIIRLSEFDEGGIREEFAEFNLWALAESVISAIGDTGDIKLILEGEKEMTIRANRRMIDELLYNLINNGVKYNNPSGSVTVNFTRAGEFCKISVTDTGIGIGKSHQDRVFERFYRVEGSRSKKTGGTGLGLSIVKHITEYHGGYIELKSAEGAGTTISCYIAG